MKGYNRVKVYVTSGSDRHSKVLHLSKGAAIDETRNGVTDRKIDESYLNYKGDLKKIQQNAMASCCVVYHMYDTLAGCTEWFLGDNIPNELKNELEEQYDYLDYTSITVKGKVDVTIYPDFSLPALINLEYGNDNKLNGRIVLEPNEIGLKGRGGKVVFPDRTVKDILWQGEAVVTEFKDKGNYGFINCKMHLKPEVSLDAIADYLFDKAESGNLELCVLNFGTYEKRYAQSVYNGNGFVSVRIFGQGTDGEVDYDSGVFLIDDFEKYTEECINIGSIWLKDAFGDEDIIGYIQEGINKCNYLNVTSESIVCTLEGMDIYAEVGTFSELVDEMLNDGILISYRINYKSLGNKFYILLNSARLYRLASYTKSEIDEVIEFVNKYNSNVDKCIAQQSTKQSVGVGKMNLH